MDVKVSPQCVSAQFVDLRKECKGEVTKEILAKAKIIVNRKWKNKKYS